MIDRRTGHSVLWRWIASSAAMPEWQASFWSLGLPYCISTASWTGKEAECDKGK
jgi:hypothetical protein